MPTPRRPHIVLFNPDQWRGDVLGHVGNPAAVTPTLDRLVAGDAVSFRHAFCQSPVCTPSRTSFLTGWYPHVRGHRTMHHMLHLDHGEPNLLQVLKDAGYFVFWGGKNDFLPGDDCVAIERTATVRYRARRPVEPDRHGDQRWRSAPGSPEYYSFLAGKLEATDGCDHHHDGDWETVQGAIELIEGYDGQAPLCVFLALESPHPPYAVEEPWYSAIDRSNLPPRAPVPARPELEPSILRAIREGQRLQGMSQERWDELRAVYYGSCARSDHLLGLLCNALRARGLYDDTAILFFSDHGDFAGDYGLVEKAQNAFHDCLVRVPFVVKPPRHVPVRARVSDALVELVDVSETVYDLAGIDPGYGRFGRSVVPLLAGGTDAHRDAVFAEGGRLEHELWCAEIESSPDLDPTELYHPRLAAQRRMPEHTKATMVRTRDIKYVHRRYDKDELYNLGKDPEETRNVIDDPAYGDAARALRDRMLSWYQTSCDVVPRTPDRR